jgi:HSP20 family protein
MARVPSLFSSGGLIGAGGGDPFLILHREMNRLFDDVLRGGPMPTGGQGDMLLAPQMDVSETDKEIRIEVELPGVRENEIEVSLNEDVLTIRAEKKQERKEEREGAHVRERSFGIFQRSLRLPFQVSPEQVQARFENGVLRVTLPKTQPQERSRRIQVQGRAAQDGSSQQQDGGSAGQSGQDGQRAGQQDGSEPSSGGSPR